MSSQSPVPHPEASECLSLLASQISHEKSLKKEEKKGYVLVPVESKTVAIHEAEKAFLRTVLGAGTKGQGLRLTLRTNVTSNIIVNSAAVKYRQFMDGNSNFAFARLAGAAEFASLDVLFDQVFIHSVTFRYKSRNKYSGTLQSSGTAADLSTCIATLYFLGWNSADYADSSSLQANATSAATHKVVNLAENFTWVVPNPTKFSWSTDVMDQTSGLTGMGWCWFNLVSSKYGGFCGCATPVPSGAAIGIGTLLEGSIFGDYTAEFLVSVRQRA